MFNDLEEESKTKSIIISSQQRKHIYIWFSSIYGFFVFT